jgi:diacylglycerol kinase
VQLYSFRDPILFPYIVGKFQLTLHRVSSSSVLSRTFAAGVPVMFLWEEEDMTLSRLWMLLPVLAILSVSFLLLATAVQNKLSEASAEHNSAKVVKTIVAAALFFASSAVFIMLNEDILSKQGFAYPCFVGNLGVVGSFVFSHSMVYLGCWQVEMPMKSSVLLRVVLPI